MMTDLKILPSTRGIIEGKQQGDAIAILVTREDLQLSIQGLEYLMRAATRHRHDDSSRSMFARIESLRDEYLELKKVGFD